MGLDNIVIAVNAFAMLTTALTIVWGGIRLGRCLGRIETVLDNHTENITELWEKKQGKDVCDERFGRVMNHAPNPET